MAATVRQTARGFSTGSNLTFEADFGDDLGPCLADSLILWIIAGDKNSGTITPPSACPNLPINLRSADASLALAWGTAAGGEEVISGTVTNNPAGGQVYIAEIVDSSGSGAWGRRSTFEHYTGDGGATVTSVALGPAPAATGDGIGIAAVGFDSVNTAGTPSWTNGWSSAAITNSGGGQAGLWAATKTGIVTDDTESTTFSRSGGSADQAQGFLVVFGREGGVVNGALAGAMPAGWTAELDASVAYSGQLAGRMPGWASSAVPLSAVIGATGQLAGAMPAAWSANLRDREPLASARMGTPTLELVDWAVGSVVIEE